MDPACFGLVLVMCVCTCVLVCVEEVHMEEHWAEFTHENQQKMPQKYVRVPSYLCSEGRERTECWKGSANFIVSCFLSASKSSGCLWAAVLKYITKTPLEKN